MLSSEARAALRRQWLDDLEAEIALRAAVPEAANDAARQRFIDQLYQMADRVASVAPYRRAGIPRGAGPGGGGRRARDLGEEHRQGACCARRRPGGHEWRLGPHRQALRDGRLGAGRCDRHGAHAGPETRNADVEPLVPRARLQPKTRLAALARKKSQDMGFLSRNRPKWPAGGTDGQAKARLRPPCRVNTLNGHRAGTTRGPPDALAFSRFLVVRVAAASSKLPNYVALDAPSDT